MSLKKEYLADLFHVEGFRVDDRPEVGFQWKKVAQQHILKDVEQVYKELQGTGSFVGVLPQPWDLQIKGVAFVIDSALDFNRYRNISLRSEFYSLIPFFPLNDYRRFCRNYEKECLKSGMQMGSWTNKLSEAHFGKASAAGDFFGNGASGWKLKAFQSFVQDLAAYFSNVKLIRLSPYENLMVNKQLVRLEKIDELRLPDKGRVIYNFLRRKVAQAGIEWKVK
jgi:hypothetical protein